MPKNKRTSTRKSRALNAFAIASAQEPERLLRANRRGEQPPSRRYYSKGDDDEVDVSDFEGHEIKMGEVDANEDSDIDSDEAMGSSDEERFEDFVFRGSSSKGTETKKPMAEDLQRKKRTELDLDEDGSDEEQEVGQSKDEGEGDGENYINLSEMLDRATPEDSGPEDVDAWGNSDAGLEKLANFGGTKRTASLASGSSESSLSEDSNAESDYDMESNAFADLDGGSDSEEDQVKMDALQKFVTSLPTALDRPPKRRRIHDPNETKALDEYNLTTSKKLSYGDLMTSVSDPVLRKSIKLLEDNPIGKKTFAAEKLSAPIPTRQKERLNRDAAYQKTKATMDRWQDTIKHNREVDHLQFPLSNAPNASIPTPNKIETLNANSSKPLNGLENTVSEILRQSNMASEQELQEFESLKTQKMSVKDVQARTAELRRQRDLMYREEVKAKRISKIKSKSYHRIKKRERVRNEKALDEAMAEVRGGDLDSEDEREQDLRRAHERMSLRHKQSRWSQGLKESGRTAWDDNARESAIEMAKRSEELRKRMHGEETRDDHSGNESVESDNGSESVVDDDGRQFLLDELDKLDSAESEDGGNRSNLMNMKFMKEAISARRKQNYDAVKRIRQSLDDDENGSRDGGKKERADKSGRMFFKPPKKTLETPFTLSNVAPEELNEDLADSDLSDAGQFEDVDEKKASSVTPRGFIKPSKAPSEAHMNETTHRASSLATEAAEENPWLPTGDSRRRGKLTSNESKYNSKLAKSSTKLSKVKSTANRMAKVADPTNEEALLDMNEVLTIPSTVDPTASVGEGIVDHARVSFIPSKGPTGITQRELVKRAFAGDNVVNDFIAEKKSIVEDEDDKVVDETLPGWGSWVGEGLSKRADAKNRGKKLRAIKGLSAGKRRDAKLDKVIINEKIVKKNLAFNAVRLPHQFENKTQYERSLRLPIGPEWTTKDTFQTATTPRVLVKKGVVVEAISAPLK